MHETPLEAEKRFTRAIQALCDEGKFEMLGLSIDERDFLWDNEDGSQCSINCYINLSQAWINGLGTNLDVYNDCYAQYDRANKDIHVVMVFDEYIGNVLGNPENKEATSSKCTTIDIPISEEEKQTVMELFDEWIALREEINPELVQERER